MEITIRDLKLLTLQLIIKPKAQAHLTRRTLTPGQNNTYCWRKLNSTHTTSTNITEGQMDITLRDHKLLAPQVIPKPKAQVQALTSGVHKIALQQGNTSIRTCHSNKLTPNNLHQTPTHETHYIPRVRITRPADCNRPS